MDSDRLLKQLTKKFREQNLLLQYKENEIKELEVKLMRVNAFSSGRRSPMTNDRIVSGSPSGAHTPLSKEPSMLPTDGVMITQRGQEIIDDRPSYACPQTAN